MKQIVLTISMFLLVFSAVFAQKNAVSEKNLYKHVSYLASDKLQGRGTGTPQERMAAEYISKQFKKIGLAPKGDNGTFYHKFKFKK